VGAKGAESTCRSAMTRTLRLELVRTSWMQLPFGCGVDVTRRGKEG